MAINEGSHVEPLLFLRCKDDPEALRLLREVTTNPNHRPASNDNIISNGIDKQGTSRSYTLDRLHREAPDQTALLLGRRYNRAKKSRSEAGAMKGSKDQSDPSFSTAERLGKEHAKSNRRSK